MTSYHLLRPFRFQLQKRLSLPTPSHQLFLQSILHRSLLLHLSKMVLSTSRLESIELPQVFEGEKPLVKPFITSAKSKQKPSLFTFQNCERASRKVAKNPSVEKKRSASRSWKPKYREPTLLCPLHLLKPDVSLNCAFITYKERRHQFSGPCPRILQELLLWS